MVRILPKQIFDQTDVNPEAICVRIVDPDQRHNEDVSGYKDEIRLEFWDIEEVVGNYFPINEFQAKELYKFLKKNCGAPLVVHCMAGVSRSNTVGTFYAQVILKDEALASVLASDQTKIINFAVWDALKNEAIKDNNFDFPFQNKD